MSEESHLDGTAQFQLSLQSGTGLYYRCVFVCLCGQIMQFLYGLFEYIYVAHQFASAYQTLATAINLRPDNAECYMLLGSIVSFIQYFFLVYFSPPLIIVTTHAVCLKHLNDQENAYLAFERSTMLPEAIKNPLIYLNFTIYCSETNRIIVAQQNLENFQKICEQQTVRGEVRYYNFIRIYFKI